MKTNLLGVFVFLLFTYGITFAQSVQEKAIVSVVESETKAFLEKDYEAWKKHWLQTDEACHHVAQVDQKLCGWKEIEQGFAPAFEQEAELTAEEPGQKTDPSKMEKKPSPPNKELKGKPAAKAPRPIDAQEIETPATFKNSDYNVQVLGNVAYVTFVQAQGDNEKTAQLSNELRILKKVGNDWKIAMVSVSPVIKKTEDSAMDQIGRGVYTLYELGKYDEALNVLDGVAQAFPKDCNPHVGFGYIYLKMDNQQKAQMHFQKALAIDPDCQDAKAGLTKATTKPGEKKQEVPSKR